MALYMYVCVYWMQLGTLPPPLFFFASYRHVHPHTREFEILVDRTTRSKLKYMATTMTAALFEIVGGGGSWEGNKNVYKIGKQHHILFFSFRKTKLNAVMLAFWSNLTPLFTLYSYPILLVFWKSKNVS